ncbi:receptor-type tyrosine-protein phosphatase kappa-like [Diadema antillarum]|uniref:receptor-type tyrosine-protein phosphatase kappa-like n=1 Tax=Diadema antillarum TaxID=105358 RepID=UPI003A87476F
MTIMSAMWGCRCNFGLCRLLEYLAVFITLCPIYLQGERVYITVLSAGFSNIESTSDTQLQCYRSSPSSEASRDYGRTAPIPSDTSPEPPASRDYVRDVRRVNFPSTTEWDVQGFGAFYCLGSQEGYDDQTISSFFKRSDAYFEPVDGKFTRTVNVGDTGVMIQMGAISNSSLENPVWRKDGGDPVTGQTTNTFMFTDPIVAEDEGIYEIHYSAMRSQGRGALYRLIVRDCPAGKWGPPDCIRVCDKCYNGGVCDDETGRCICPNNFRGPNCLEICRTEGGNRFGPNCEFRCTYVGDPPAECSPHQFCLPDPFGCSCDTGTQGINCNTDCSNGTYGAGCTQTCHCQSGHCNRYSGVCTESSDCETGWSGDNCQIPDICDDGYYGTNCTYKCHCLNDVPCDKITGECSNRQCAPFFNIYDGVNCRGITNVFMNVKVNPNQPSFFTCVVEGDPPPKAANVSLFRLRDVLPVIEAAPTVNASTFTSLTIEWMAWNEQTDNIGDPPLTEYITYYRILNGTWIDGPKVAASRTSAVLSGLDQCTKYEVSVAAVREGPGGTGPKSNSFATVTECPRITNVSMDVTVNPYQPSSFTCLVEGNPPPNAGNVSLYRLRDGVGDDSGISQTQTSLDASGVKRSIIFRVDQMTSGQYECALHGNRSSLSVDVVTYVLPVMEAAPTVNASTFTSLTIEWIAWNEHSNIGDPPVTEYIIYYRIPDEKWIDGRRVSASMTSAELSSLHQCTEYEVSVAAVREGPGGTGPKSNSSAKETECPKITNVYMNVKVNPYQPSFFTCVVEGDPPPNAANVSLYQLRDAVEGGQEHESVGIELQKKLVWIGGRLGSVVLPVMEAVPTVNASTSTSLIIEWMAWNEQTDIGDPPVTEYITYYRIPNENWIDGPKVPASMTSATLSGLDPDTKYEISAAAIREGPGGTGPKSDSLTIVTKCANLSAPVLVSATPNVPRQITVTWQARPKGTKKCSTGFTNYTFYYTTENTHFSGSETLNNSEVTQTDLEPYLRYTLTDLEPYLQYTITVTAVRNDSESATSSEVTVRTLEEAPPMPVNVAIFNSTQDSLIVTWSAATPIHRNGEIRAYKLRYSRISPVIDDHYTIRTVNEVQHEMKYQILELSPGSMYSIQVRTVNCAGESDWSPLTTGETKSEPDANGALAGGIVGGVFIFFIIVGLVVGFISRRRNQDQKQLNIIDVSAPEQGRDTVVCENAYAVAPENNLYEGLKNVPVIELAASSCNPERKSESMNPRCYRKYELILQDDSRNIEMTTFKGCGSPSCSKKWSGSHDNLDEPEMEESNRNNMYQNLAAPGPIPVHELQAYIEHKKAEKGNGLIQEYQMLKSNQLHPWNVASKEQNKAKNRFENIIAYDHSRVVLETVDGDPHSDYYNANYIRNFRGEKVIIASQAPNEASLTDFWRMIWQENVETVVMVTALTQNGKDECTQYWPEETRSINIGNFSIFLFEEHTFSDHVIRELDVKMGRSEEKRTVTQFHYMSWSKKEVPEDYTTLLDFVDVVLRHHTTMPLFKRNRPMLVHCSAGAGRTGTFLTLYNMLFMMRETEKVDIFGFVNQMRENRIKMVDTQDQYLFIYNALLEVYFLGQTHTPVAQFKKKLSTLNRVDPKTKKINIQLEYELLDSLAPVPPRNAFRGGKMPQNKNKNRFPDILPLERKRPCLISEGLEDSTDYINASLMNTFTEEGAFVVTQAPLPNTEVDIWRLVFDWKCPVIVMLNELDPSDWTCPQYWPSAGTFQMGSLNITRVGSSSEPHFVCNTFTVSSKGESVTVTQFRLLGWSAASTYLRSRMSLIHLVRAAQKAVKTAHTSGPVIVHCINGTGWSGVFCALWSVIDKFERKNTVDIFHAVKNLRTNRPNMVESLDQYKLCYDVMSKYLYGESAGECVRGYAYFLLRELEGE